MDLAFSARYAGRQYGKQLQTIRTNPGRPGIFHARRVGKTRGHVARVEHNPTIGRINLITIPLVYGESRAQDYAGEVCGFWSATDEQIGGALFERTGGSLKNVDSSCIRQPRLDARQRAAFCRLTRPKGTAIVHFHFNAWAKYDDWPKDRKCPRPPRAGSKKRLFKAQCQGRDFVMEGGGIEVNGAGTLLTTEESYLDPQVQVRNPGLTRADYETAFRNYFGVRNVLWLLNGLVGDDTHGHIDDICRFVNPRTLVLVQETNRREVNTVRWRKMGAVQDFPSRWVAAGMVPCPCQRPLYFDGYRLPASYANFTSQRRRAGPRLMIPRPVRWGAWASCSDRPSWDSTRGLVLGFGSSLPDPTQPLDDAAHLAVLRFADRAPIWNTV